MVINLFDRVFELLLDSIKIQLILVMSEFNKLWQSFFLRLMGSFSILDILPI